MRFFTLVLVIGMAFVSLTLAANPVSATCIGTDAHACVSMQERKICDPFNQEICTPAVARPTHVCAYDGADEAQSASVCVLNAGQLVCYDNLQPPFNQYDCVYPL